MNRAKDLDIIAPDDPIVEAPIKSPAEIKKKESSSKNFESRQKIYQLLKHKTKHSLDPFLAHPKVFDFQEREEEEEIILVLRQHWVTNISWTLITILMIFAPTFLKYVPLLASFPANFQLVALIIWYSITTAYAFEKFLSWYFNLFIITDERIIDIDFINLIDKRFTDTRIAMVQDVTAQVVGVIQTMFNYGNVLIQTASAIPEIEFKKIPKPELVIKVLQLMRQEEEKEFLEGRQR